MAGGTSGVRARMFAAALGALVLVACANSAEEPAAQPGTIPTVGGAAPAESDGGADPAPSTAPTRSRGGATPPSSAQPSATTAPTRDGERDRDPIAELARAPVGRFAPVLLQAAPARRLVLEVQQAPGAEPGQATVDAVANVLREVSGKPVAVQRVPIDARDTSWTPEELRAAADAGARTAQGEGTAVIRALFVNGGLAGNEAAVGAAVRGDTLAVFADKVDAAATPLVDRARFERSVLTHEVGHLLGLVDLYLDTGRADPDHPGHSPNRESVMYWAVESTLVGQVLTGPPPVEFDAADRADLRRIAAGA